MATTLGWSNLKLRNKLSIIYTISFTLTFGAACIFIYYICEKNREQEFYQRLKDRTVSTFNALQADEIDSNLLSIFDKNRINTMSQEKILLFDPSGKLIYNSTANNDNEYAADILKQLKESRDVFIPSDDSYELLGIQLVDRHRTYYGVTKAYDDFGKNKMHFLALLLAGTFAVVTLFTILVSSLLSRIVTRRITKLTTEVEDFSLDDLSKRIDDTYANDEIGFLAGKFNELLTKVENAFTFQSHFIHHLSHELKTPLAIMLANAERALNDDDPATMRNSMQFQKNFIMDLSNIIIAMLEITRAEKEISISEQVRIDEVLFECMDEVTILNPNVKFDFKLDGTPDEKSLTIKGSNRMIKMAVINLLKNAVNYSDIEQPAIQVTPAETEVIVKISNDGKPIDEDERPNVFRHMFRGRNSSAIKGFGLGLVLTHRIIQLHTGSIEYTVKYARNVFTLRLPTS